MKKLLSLLAYSYLLMQTAQADVLVLAHGYLSDSQSWVQSGVVQQLRQNGYHHTGDYKFSRSGVVFRANGEAAGDNAVYTVDLPSQAPVLFQADWLSAFLRDIEKRHPEENIVLAGHSAGGVVARAALVRHGAGRVDRLITIASPHLGTGRAAQALDATNDGGMFGMFKRWIVKRKTGDALYHSVKQSRGLLLDLLPPQPGSMLFWLNQQAHPEITYISVMRTGPFQMGDQVVPTPSQDLRLVPALKGKAKSYQMAQGHMLTTLDGNLLVNLLLE